MIRVLSIGTDRNIFKEGSAVRARMVEYGRLFSELHIIVFAKKDQGLLTQKISDNVTVYPTQSRTRLGYISDAYSVGRVLLGQDKEKWVVSTQDPFETGLAGLRLARHFGMPLQIQIHTDFLSPYFKAQSVLNRIRVMIARRVLPRADGIRVVSERIKQSILKKGYKLKTVPTVLPIDVDVEKIINAPAAIDLKKQFPQFQKHVLMASRLSPEKNISFALDVFAECHKKIPATGLIIVGSGGEEQRLRAKARSLKLENAVVFLGWQENVVSLYKTADVFLQASSYEGYGLSLAEAALSRCPIVTSDVGIAGSILSDADAAICPVGDRACFTKKLLEILSNDAHSAQLKENAFSAIKKSLTSHEEYLTSYARLLTSL